MLNEVSTPKQHVDGDIVIAGSFQLVRTLIEHDLVNELRLKTFPVALGVGEASDKNPCASSTPRPSRAASPTSPTNLSGTPSGVRRSSRSEMLADASPGAGIRESAS